MRTKQNILKSLAFYDSHHDLNFTKYLDFKLPESYSEKEFIFEYDHALEKSELLMNSINEFKNKWFEK